MLVEFNKKTKRCYWFSELTLRKKFLSLWCSSNYFWALFAVWGWISETRPSSVWFSLEMIRSHFRDQLVEPCCLCLLSKSAAESEPSEFDSAWLIRRLIKLLIYTWHPRKTLLCRATKLHWGSFYLPGLPLSGRVPRPWTRFFWGWNEDSVILSTLRSAINK